jgi:hypothetical protein
MLSFVGPVVRRPSLWVTGLRQARNLAPRRWWAHRPFLPVPAPDYLHFRMVTMYGGDGSSATAGDDLVAWLEWCRAWPEISR